MERWTDKAIVRSMLELDACRLIGKEILLLVKSGNSLISKTASLKERNLKGSLADSTPIQSYMDIGEGKFTL